MTRSRTEGKARSGVITTGSSGGSVDIRVMQSSRGRPFTSALHEPHLPALQFHRTARSGAWVACRRCTRSSTTSPSWTSTWYETKPPSPASPRQTRNSRSLLIGQLLRGEVLRQLLAPEERQQVGTDRRVGLPDHLHRLA